MPTHFEAIERWLTAQPRWISLTPCIDASKESEVASLLTSVRDQLTLMQEAALWIRIGEITRSHSIVQHDSSDAASYMHGMIHRIEGDYWNANYWFNRVRDPSLLKEVQASVAALVDVHCGSQKASRFSPRELSESCEQALQKRTTVKRDELEFILFAEWLGVWQICSQPTKKATCFADRLEFGN